MRNPWQWTLFLGAIITAAVTAGQASADLIFKSRFEVGEINRPITDLLSVYSPVPGLDPSPHYRFRVRQVESEDWMEPFAWFTDTPRFDEVGDDNKWYSDLIGGWSHTYSNFEMAEGVMVEVEITRLNPETGEPVDIQTATPHPRRKVRSWRVEDGKAYVIFDKPALFAVDIDGQLDENLAPRAQGTGWGPSAFPFVDDNAIHTVSVFANPFITDKPDPDDPSVYTVEPGEIPPEDGDWTTLYFLPGVHQLFEGELMDEYYEGFDFQLKSNKSYYIPGDAIVYGHMNTRDHLQNAPWPALKENIRVFGHGTLSGARSLHPEDMEAPFSHISDEEGLRFRSMDIFATGSVVEGITFADSANHTMKMNTRGHASLDQRPANYARWLKVITWRTNGDGITMLGNGYLENSFIRAQDDGSYVRGLGIRDVVYWNDVNGTALRNTFLMNDRGDDFPSSLPQTLYVEDIDIIYGRGAFNFDNSRYSVIQKQNFRQTDSNTGSHVVFRNINFEDPLPARSLFGFDVEIDGGNPTGSPSGVRFENVRAASPAVFGRPNTFIGGPDNQISGFIFDNVILAGRQINSLDHEEFLYNEHTFGFIFDNTEPQTRTFLNTSGYGKWYVWDDWDNGVEPADHDIVDHTSVAVALTVDAPAYAGYLNVSHPDGAVVRTDNGGVLAVTHSVSLGSSNGSGYIRLIDGRMAIRDSSSSALSVSSGDIHFDKGTLQWDGNQIARIQELHDEGAFTFGGGQPDTHSDTAIVIAETEFSTLYAEYDASAGYTTVWLVEG